MTLGWNKRIRERFCSVEPKLAQERDEASFILRISDTFS